jgi:hypothetical protein
VKTDHKDAIRATVVRIAGLAESERHAAVQRLVILAGIRQGLEQGRQEGRVEGEEDCSAGRSKSALAPSPTGADAKLAALSLAEIESPGKRIFDATK